MTDFTAAAAEDQWLLAGVTKGRPGYAFHIEHVRVLNDAEMDDLDEASALMTFITQGSPLASLQRAHHEWVATYDRAQQAYLKKEPMVADVFRIDLPKSVNALFFEFKAFIDQNRRWISKTYGRKSPVLKGFDEECKAVYDSSIAYRVGYNLRNAAQHRTSVITIQGSDGMENGNRVRKIEVRMAEDAVDDKWQKPVRAQLDRPIYMAPILDGVLDGCELMHARLLIDCEERAVPAARLLRDTAREVTDAIDGDANAALVQDGTTPGGGGPLSMRAFRYDLADVYENALGQARTLLRCAAA
jgi:hypothetical protein